MARKKKVIINENINRETAEEIFADYAKVDAQIVKINAELDIKIAKIREAKQDALAKLSERREEAFAKLEHYAITNPELFSKKKSLELSHGTIGYRTGTPKLKTFRGFTWAAVTSLIKEVAPQYLRTKEEPNKDAIIADRDKDGMKEIMDKMRVNVVQDETFYVQPKKEEVPA